MNHWQTLRFMWLRLKYAAETDDAKFNSERFQRYLDALMDSIHGYINGNDKEKDLSTIAALTDENVFPIFRHFEAYYPIALSNPAKDFLKLNWGIDLGLLVNAAIRSRSAVVTESSSTVSPAANQSKVLESTSTSSSNEDLVSEASSTSAPEKGLDTKLNALFYMRSKSGEMITTCGGKGAKRYRFFSNIPDGIRRLDVHLAELDCLSTLAGQMENDFEKDPTAANLSVEPGEYDETEWRIYRNCQKIIEEKMYHKPNFGTRSEATGDCYEESYKRLFPNRSKIIFGAFDRLKKLREKLNDKEEMKEYEKLGKRWFFLPRKMPNGMQKIRDILNDLPDRVCGNVEEIENVSNEVGHALLCSLSLGYSLYKSDEAMPLYIDQGIRKDVRKREQNLITGLPCYGFNRERDKEVQKWYQEQYKNFMLPHQSRPQKHHNFGSI